MSNRKKLLDLAARIADGEPIEWARQRDSLGKDDAGVVDRLAMLERLRNTLENRDEEPSERRVPARWGHLEIRARLGEGSFATVYSALDRDLEREVALKLRVGSDSTHDDVSGWLDEARRLARVRHPNVLAVHGAGVHEGIPGIWSERLQGFDLAVWRRRGPVASEALLETAAALLSALSAVHAEGLVHGDVKPGNVMREPDGRLVLMDFSASVEVITSRVSDDRAGSPLAMAPERFLGAPITPAVDLFGVGVVLYYLIEGRFPVPAGSMEGIRGWWRRGLRPRFRNRAPRALRRLVLDLLASDPEARPDAKSALRSVGRIRTAPQRLRRRISVSAVIVALSAALGYSLDAKRDAARAQRESEAVNRFLTDLLASPRRTHHGPNLPIVALLDDAARRAGVRLADQPRAQADVLAAIGTSYLQLRQPEPAADLLDQAIALNEQLDRPVEAASARVERARVALAQGDPARARRLNLQSLEALPETGAEPARVRVLNRIGLALASIQQGLLDQAREELDEALAVADASGLAGKSPQWALALLESGQLALRRGRTEPAVAPLRRSLDFFLERYGARNHNAFSARNALVEALDRLGRLDEASRLAHENLEVANAWLGPTDRLSLLASDTLANLLSRRGRPAEALELNRDTLRRIEGSPETDPELRLQLEANQVAFLLDTGRYEEALRLSRSALPELLDHFGPRHPTTLITGLNQVDALLVSGRAVESLARARDYRRQLTEIYGEAHLFVRVATYLEGGSLSALARFESAEPLLTAAHAALSAQLGESNPLTLKAAGLLGLHWQRTDRVEPAIALVEPSHAEALEALGPDHVRTRDLASLLEALRAQR